METNIKHSRYYTFILKTNFCKLLADPSKYITSDGCDISLEHTRVIL